VGVSTLASAGAPENHERGSYQAICIVSLFFRLLYPAGADLGEEIRAEEADGEDNQHERDNQLNERRKHLANLQGHAAHGHGELRHTLASRRGWREQGRQDAIGQCREELGNHATQVERGRKYDDILSVQHFCLLNGAYFIFQQTYIQLPIWTLAIGAQVAGNCSI